MSLVLLLLKKDVRRFRVLLVLWVLPLVFTLLQAGLGRPADGAGRFSMASHVFIWVVSFLAPILLWLLLVTIIPLVIQEEPTVGSTAFWFTRPLSGRVVLLAKAGFIGGCLILSVSAVELAILVMDRVPPLGLGLAALDIVFGWLVTTSYLMTLAVLTQTFARFSIAGASVVVAYWLTASLLLGVFSMKRGIGSHQSFFLDSTLATSRGLVASALAVAVGTVIVVSQYAARRTTWARAAALFALLGILMVDYVWNWDFLGRRAPATVSASVPALLSVTLVPDSLSISEPRSRYGGEPGRVVFGRLEFSGMPPGYVAQPESIVGTVYLGGTRVDIGIEYAMDRMLEAAGRALSFREWNPAGVQRALGDVHLANIGATQHGLIPLAEVGDELYTRHGEAAGPYSASVSFGVKAYHLAGTVPLKPGARLAWTTGHAQITGITPRTDGIEVTLHETDVDLAWRKERYSQSVFGSFFPWGRFFHEDPSQHAIYILKLRNGKEALWPGEGSSADFDPERRFLASHLQRLPLRLRYLTSVQPGSPKIDAGSLVGAELVRIEARDFGSFSKGVRAEELRLPRS